MARKKAAKGFRWRLAGMAGALALALAGGGYYIGQNFGGNGLALPEKIVALLPAGKAAPKAADAKPADSPIVKLVDRAALSRLLKGAESKLIGSVRPEVEKRGKSAARAEARKTETNKTETNKTETNKTEASKTEASKTETAKAEAKAEAAKAEAAKPDAKAAANRQGPKTQVAKPQAAQANDAGAPLPPARIPDVAKADAAPASIAEAIAEPEEKPAQPVARPAPGQATSGGAPLGVALTGKGIPTSEDNKMRLSVAFSNRAGKPIRAFEGVLKFADQSDHSLFSSKISVSALIAEGGTINWDERIDPDKLDAKDKKLVDADKDSIKAIFVPKKVFFVDGSVQQFGAKGERVALR